MSEDNQSENQSQASPDSQTSANTEDTPPKLQAVESLPKPEPSVGYIEFSEDVPPLASAKRIEPLPKPDPSFGTHIKEASRKSSHTVDKRDKAE